MSLLESPVDHYTIGDQSTSVVWSDVEPEHPRPAETTPRDLPQESLQADRALDADFRAACERVRSQFAEASVDEYRELVGKVFHARFEDDTLTYHQKLMMDQCMVDHLPVPSTRGAETREKLQSLFSYYTFFATQQTTLATMLRTMQIHHVLYLEIMDAVSVDGRKMKRKQISKKKQATADDTDKATLSSMQWLVTTLLSQEPLSDKKEKKVMKKMNNRFDRIKAAVLLDDESLRRLTSVFHQTVRGRAIAKGDNAPPPPDVPSVAELDGILSADPRDEDRLTAIRESLVSYPFSSASVEEQYSALENRITADKIPSGTPLYDALSRCRQDGDWDGYNAAKETLIETNMRIVFKIVKEHCRMKGTSIEPVFYGVLMRVVRVAGEARHELGNRFATFIGNMVRYYLLGRPDRQEQFEKSISSLDAVSTSSDGETFDIAAIGVTDSDQPPDHADVLADIDTVIKTAGLTLEQERIIRLRYLDLPDGLARSRREGGQQVWLFNFLAAQLVKHGFPKKSGSQVKDLLNLALRKLSRAAKSDPNLQKRLLHAIPDAAIRE